MEELRQKRNWELQGIRSFGAKSFREVQEALERLEAEKPVNNADRIRAMSDEELEAFLINVDLDKEGSPFITEWGKWLQQPAEEG